MGSIESYETAKGRCYRALYRRPDKKQTQKRGFTTKKAAELFLATTEVDIAQGRYLDPSLARVTVADWLHTWLAARGDLRATTRSRVENIVEKHIVPELGTIPIGNLTRLRVQEWASALPGAPATVRKIVNVLSGACGLRSRTGDCPPTPPPSGSSCRSPPRPASATCPTIKSPRSPRRSTRRRTAASTATASWCSCSPTAAAVGG